LSCDARSAAFASTSVKIHLFERVIVFFLGMDRNPWVAGSQGGNP
jgi:hypothetical protein